MAPTNIHANPILKVVSWLLLQAVLLNGAIPAAGQAYPLLGAPTLKWSLGGCYSSWCETGWYSSPATADLDGDGRVEVVASAYTIFVLDGPTGALKWKMPSGHDRSEPGESSIGRTWPGIVISDVDNDGQPEIVTAHSGGVVSVYNRLGYFKPGWPQQPTTSELRGLSVSDLDGDHLHEIVVTAAIGSAVNTWVYEPNGTLNPGWPQLSNSSGYAWGVYNANAAAGDMNGDENGEIVVPSDVHYICAYRADGTQIPANPIYGNKGWGKVGVWESLATELRGWGECNGERAESYRTNFADGPSVIADVNSDGNMEVVATGNVYDCQPGYYSKYDGVYIFNADRSRFYNGKFDWRSAPVDTGAPLSENYNVIETAEPNPAVADLDHDGNLEILYASYDGRMHAFWLDKTEHGNWPYSVYHPGEGTFRFASEPVIADLDDNGFAEVIFTSWTQKGSYLTGQLHILNFLGFPIFEINLPGAFGSEDWNGALPAPTLADIDADHELEAVILTANSGVVAYDLPGTGNATILWGTGRGDYQRDGYQPNALQSSLRDSTKRSSQTRVNPGGTLTFTITLRNPGAIVNNADMTDPLPTLLTYGGNLKATSGSASYASGVVRWNGTVDPGVDVVIQFDALVDPGINAPTVIINSATITDGLGRSWLRQAYIIPLGIPVFLPLMGK